MSTLSCRGIIATSSVFLSFLFVSVTQAGTIVPCGGDEFCSVGFSVDMTAMGGASMNGTGEFVYNSTTGDISLNLDSGSTNGMVSNGNIVWQMPNGTSITIGSINGNADPLLGFGFIASTGAASATFGFSFTLPISLQGSIYAESSLGYSLTALSAAGATLTSLGANILTAFDVDTTAGGLGSINKGVDIGGTFGFSGSGTQATSFGATNTFTGDLAYDQMTVDLDFGLTANSTVGITGFVSQTEVPVPAAAWLFISAFGGLLALRKTS